MNRIDVSAEEIPLPVWTNAVQSFAEKILAALRHSNWDVSIVFCTNHFIQTLNRKYRNQNKPTDVLSFRLGEYVAEDGEERYLAGDIVISLEMLYTNACFFSVSQDEELRRLLIHGLLHLDGKDHGSAAIGDTDKKALDDPMLVLQETMLADLHDEVILDSQGQSEMKYEKVKNEF